MFLFDNFIRSHLCRTVLYILLVVIVSGLVDALQSRSGSGINDMIPIPGGSRWKFQVSFDQQNAGVANFAGSFFVQIETFAENAFVLFAVGESGAAGLGFADATSAT